MTQQQNTPKFLRQRKSLLVLPILIIPFITLAFWALGGGKGSDAQAAQGNPKTGLNLELPGANIKDDGTTDKLGYYDKAASDSAKLRELMKNDPYFNKHISTEDSILKYVTQTNANSPLGSNSINADLNSPAGNGKYTDPNEAKVYEKLAQLNTALNDASAGKSLNVDSKAPAGNQPTMQTEDISRLDQMMQGLNANSSNSEDPEMKQLNGMLEKILDIQHPDRIKDQLKEKSLQNKDEVFTVNRKFSKASISLLDTCRGKKSQDATTDFYGVSDEKSEATAHNAIEAVVHEAQTLVNGAVIKMRLLNDIFINGHIIPKDNFFYGTTSLNNERLEISINSIRDEHALFPVKLEVYDMDGLPGIFIPGAISRDVAKQSTDKAIQSVALSSLDPSVGAQAASAGIEAAKTLLSKKVKLIKVQVKAGYKILLKDNNQQQ